MTRLQVLVCTYGPLGPERIAAHSLPQVPGVSYLVSWQQPGNGQVPPALACRDDVRIVTGPTKGLSVNRNVALDSADAPYVLIADDDLDFFPDGLSAIIEAFDADSTLSLLTFRHSGPSDKVYPPDGHNLADKYSGYYITSFEIALRLSDVRSKKLRFNPLAGIGANYITQGEEELFVLDALRAGLRGRFVDKVVSHHADLPTGKRDFGAGSMRSRGALVRKRHPLTGWLRMPVTAWRLRMYGGFAFVLGQMYRGALYGLRYKL